MVLAISFLATEVNSCQFMTNNSHHLITATEGGILSIYDFEKKSFLNKIVKVDEELDGGFTQISSMDHLIYGLTAQSSIFCYDARSNHSRFSHGLETIFHRKARSSYGYITSMTVDPLNQHWMLLTSSTAGCNNIFLYDLRFLALEVAAWGHPHKTAQVLNSWPIVDTKSTECTRVTTGISKEGELSVWDLGSTERSHILWSGTSTPDTKLPAHQKDELTYHVGFITIYKFAYYFIFSV